MKSEDLLKAINELDEDLVLDAESSQPPKHSVARRITTALVAAAIAATLGVTAFAQNDEKQKGDVAFIVLNEDAISGTQLADIRENAQPINQSVTQNGYTLTVESAMVDPYDAYFIVTIQAPEGEVLDADKYTFPIKLPEEGRPIFPLSRPDGTDFGYSHSMKIIDDGNTKDSSFTFLEEYHLNRNHDVTFTDGAVWTLYYEDMHAYHKTFLGFRKSWTRLEAEGVWRFDLVFDNTHAQEVELLSEPLPYTATLKTTGDHINVQITSIKLRPISADIAFDGFVETNLFTGFSELLIVMKDGSTVSMWVNGGENGVNNYSTYTPIVLDEADYILLPDGTRLMMP